MSRVAIVTDSASDLTTEQARAAGTALLAHAMTRLSLSARAYHRILKVARTIADLADTDTIQAAQVAEAVGYRHFDRGQ